MRKLFRQTHNPAVHRMLRDKAAQAAHFYVEAVEKFFFTRCEA
jgi:hypothetical protein